MARLYTSTYTVELDLVVGQNEDRLLMHKMLCAARLYNCVHFEALKCLFKMKNSPEWKEAKHIKDPKEKSLEYRRLLEVFKFRVYDLYNFAYDIIKQAGWSDALGADIVCTITKNSFEAVEKYCYTGKGKPRSKDNNKPLHSLSGTRNTQNIIWKPNQNQLKIGSMELQVKVPTEEQDPYIFEALKSRTKYCRILYRIVNGKRRWYVQLNQEGTPPQKYKFKQEGMVGLDIGPSTVAVVSNGQADLLKFCPTVEVQQDEWIKIQRSLDSSRRSTNPTCYNENGTIIKGSKFKYSKNSFIILMQN